MEYKYFTINELPETPGRKTATYSIVSKSSGIELGQIRWYGPWRQYCFYPSKETVWSVGCQESIIDFLDKLKEAKTKEAKQTFGWN